MANLGSDNTPVKGENFSLPAGAQIDEDDGDLVVRDSGGSIVLRRDEGAGTWDFVSEDVAGIASLNAETIDNGTQHFAADYPGSDADARLDNAISAASDNDTIHLESANYQTDRDISKKLRLTGYYRSGKIDGCVWTLVEEIEIIGLRIEDGGQLAVNKDLCQMSNIRSSPGSNGISVDADRVLISIGFGIEVTFGSDTSDGLVDSCVLSDVTDNGSNNVGDIS